MYSTSYVFCISYLFFFFFFFLNDTATTEIYPLPLHDALPIYGFHVRVAHFLKVLGGQRRAKATAAVQDELYASIGHLRSEEHTSELQSQSNLVCRLLLEKKKIHKHTVITSRNT